MKPQATGVLICLAFVILAVLPAVSQTPQTNSPQPPAPAKKAPENLPWTRFHPAAAPYQPTDAEKQQIQAKTEQLGKAIGELRSRRADDALLADSEIFLEAARWKM